jgi:hypothetical protein
MVGAHFGLAPRRHQSDTSIGYKVASVSKATSPSARRSAKRLQACCWG